LDGTSFYSLASSLTLESIIYVIEASSDGLSILGT